MGICWATLCCFCRPQQTVTTTDRHGQTTTKTNNCSLCFGGPVVAASGFCGIKFCAADSLTGTTYCETHDHYMCCIPGLCCCCIPKETVHICFCTVFSFMGLAGFACLLVGVLTSGSSAESGSSSGMAILIVGIALLCITIFFLCVMYCMHYENKQKRVVRRQESYEIRQTYATGQQQVHQQQQVVYPPQQQQEAWNPYAAREANPQAYDAPAYVAPPNTTPAYTTAFNPHTQPSTQVTQGDKQDEAGGWTDIKQGAGKLWSAGKSKLFGGKSDGDKGQQRV